MPASSRQPVSAKHEPLTLLTEHDPLRRELPTFFKNSSNYPEIVNDNIVPEPLEKTYNAVVLDNGLIRVTVLPELGGHVYSAYDLVNKRDIFFRPEPLKIGLVQRCGAWSAFGLEFNHPTGHGFYSRSEIDHYIEQEGDDLEEGAVWCGRVDPQTGIRGDVRISLKAGEAKFHTFIRLTNQSLSAQRWYHWSNAAVTAGKGWRFISPTYYMYFYHNKLQTWPFVDGMDNSLYENRTGSDSFSAGCLEDYFGCYHHGTGEGTVFVADHRMISGKKFFTWGSSRDAEFIQTNFTGDGKVYTEIQSGPMETQWFYSRMEPFGKYEWNACWYGIKDTGPFFYADDDICIGVTPEDTYLDGVGAWELRLAATVNTTASITLQRGKKTPEPVATVRLKAGAKAKTVSLPRALKKGDTLTVTLPNYPRALSIPYRPTPDTDIVERVNRHLSQATGGKETPAKFIDPMDPVHRAWSIEAHAGLRAALPAYDEAISKTADLASTGKPEERIVPAMAHLRRGEALLKLGRRKEALADFSQAAELGLAEKAFYFKILAQPLSYTPKKSELDNAYRLVHPEDHTATIILAIYYMRLRNWGLALRLLQKALSTGGDRSTILGLDALAQATFAREHDLPIAVHHAQILKELRKTAPLLPANLDLPGAFGHAPVMQSVRWNGPHMEWMLRADIASVDFTPAPTKKSSTLEWLMYAYRLHHCDKKTAAARRALAQAVSAKIGSDMPWAAWQLDVLKWAQKTAPNPTILYLTGCLYAGVGNDVDGIRYFRLAIKHDPKMWAAWRAIGLYEKNVMARFGKARDAYQKAYALNPNSRDVCFEYEDVLRRLGDKDTRMAILTAMEPESKRGHFWPTRMAKLLYDMERYEESFRLQLSRTVVAWEGEFSQRQTFIFTCIELARRAIRDKRFDDAFDYLRHASELKPNILYAPRENREHAAWLYWMGVAAEKQGDADAAERYYNQAVDAPEPRIIGGTISTYLRFLATIKAGREDNRQELKRRHAEVNRHMQYVGLNSSLRYEMTALNDCMIGDFDGARHNIRKAIRLDKSNPRLVELKRAIQAKKLPFLNV